MGVVPWEASERLRIRAREAFDRHRLSEVHSPDELTARIVDITGKSLVIQKLDDPALKHTTALWIEYRDFSKVLLRAGDRLYYQLRGLHHEFGHMIFAHPGCEGIAIGEGLRKLAGDGIVRGRVLMTANAMSPLSCDDEHEAEAEAMGELLTRSLLRPSYLASERVFG